MNYKLFVKKVDQIKEVLENFDENLKILCDLKGHVLIVNFLILWV